jgi:hypothetical protein
MSFDREGIQEQAASPAAQARDAQFATRDVIAATVADF